MRATLRVLRMIGAVALTTVCFLGAAAPAARASGDWTWPVVGPILRGFDPPDDPYGSGHRGIDIGAPAGTVVVAPAAGTVTFAGTVAGSFFVTIDHGGGLASTYSWLTELLVRRGDRVTSGEPIARSGYGHPGDTVDSLHMGVKLNGAYVDPLDYLTAPDLTTMIRLAPLLGSP
jgi:murein DD-endopeptidase MepM/ murein hydrolase activator NlpD